MLAALALALLIAFGLGAAAYALSLPEVEESLSKGNSEVPSTEFIFFSILTLSYLLWSTLPLSVGSTRQFDPGNLLLYPISLRKLFAVDFLSEIASLQSVLAIPSILAMGLGAGLAQHNVPGGLLIAFAAAIFGVALSKWISASLGAVLRRKRARGETLIALIGVVVGLGGAVFGQIAPILFRHTESFTALRWTPPGAVSYALTHGLNEGELANYLLALTLVLLYSAILIGVTYWLSRRAVLGAGGTRRAHAIASAAVTESYTGWKLPLLSPELSTIVEKELRYLSRNAQVRMLTFMPLILVVVRIMNKRRLAQVNASDGTLADFFKYGEGLMATVGVLYVFLILSGLFCNQFAFEGSGMRMLILSPIDRRYVLIGKNLAVTFLALIFSVALLFVNEMVFRDLTLGALVFVAFSFLIFAALMSMAGNWLSIRFPKRMKFGKSVNVSGVVGLLLIPMILVLALAPVAAAVAGYLAESLVFEYGTLAALAVVTVALYLLVIDSQGESLQRRELEILEAVNEPDNG